MMQNLKNLTFFLLSFAVITVAHGETASQQEKSLTLGTGEKVDYLFYDPSQGGGDEKLPLLLFLHGGGESGNDLKKVSTHGPPRRIEEGHAYPMIVVSPLNPDTKGFWDEDRLARFLDELSTEVEYDKSRVYLVGMSRGANGAYRLAMENPKRFAALLVLCGAAPTPYAGWLEDLPVWIVHGEKDPVIPVSESKRMEKAILEKGGNVRLTLHPEAQHDVWTKTFEGLDVETWLLSHQRDAVK